MKMLSRIQFNPIAKQVHAYRLVFASSSRCFAIPAQVYTIKPQKLPDAPVKLNDLDLSMMHFPGVTTHNFYKGHLETAELEAALSRVIDKNPGLAGRMRSTSDSGLEVRFDGKLGAVFNVRPLPAEMESKLEKFDSETIANNPLEWEQTIEQLGIQNTGPGPDQIDKDAPLLAATYMQGERISTLSLSVSHLFGDGATKMMTLKAWDEEFKKPGSSVPMASRDKVMETDAFVKSSYTDWEQAAMKAFYPAVYEKHTLSRKIEDYNMVVVRIQEASMKKIKKAEAAKFEKGTIFSGQDALIAWIGNVLGAKWFSFTVDLRGRLEGLDLNAAGNAFMTWYGTPTSPGEFNAMDIRKTINLKGLNNAKALEEALFAGLEDSIDVNSWVKLQYPPAFGGTFMKQCRAIGYGSLPFLIRLNYHVVYQVQKGEYIMFHFGLKDEEALKMELEWRKLGDRKSVV